MDFGEVFSKAWKIIWKYKILWLFGIFASCSGGGGGGGGGGGSSSVNYSGDLPPGAYNTMNNIDPWMIVMLIIGILLLCLILAVIVTAVSTVGRIGLIQGTQLADEDEDAHVTFGGLFSSMRPFFWRILFLNLLIGVGFFILVMAIVFLFIFMSLTICLLPLVCILVPILAIGLWVLTAFVEMANVAVVTEDLGVIDGIQRGWQVFRENIVEMILMGLALVFGGMIVGLLIALPFIVVMIPFMVGIFGFVFGDSNALSGGVAITSALCCLAYFPVLLVLSGIIRAYIGSAWTLTFLRLTQGPAAAEALPQAAPADEVIAAIATETEADPDMADETDEAASSDNSLPEDF